MSSYKRPTVRKRTQAPIVKEVYNKELDDEIQRLTNIGLSGTYNQLAGIARASLRGRKRAENERERLRKNRERKVLIKKIRNVRGTTRFTYKPTLVLFSGVAEKRDPDLKSLFIKKLDPMVHEVNVLAGQDILATHTREYGIKTLQKGGLRYDSVVFKGKLGRRAFSLRIFRTGKCTFTGGYSDGAVSLRKDPMYIVRTILKNVDSFELKSCMAEIDTGYKIRPGVEPFTLLSLITKAIPEYSNYTMPIPEEGIMQPFVSVGPIRVFPNGKIQLYQFSNELEYARIKSVAGVVIRTLEKSGIYVPRVSDVPPSRATKAQFRHTNQIAPNIKSRATTCPKDRRPTPYSFGGEPIGPGWYVGANPQGQPCCYKIPKVRKDYMKPKIIQRFANLGIRIPRSAKNAFGIDVNNSNKPINVSGKEPDTLKFSILGDAIYYGMKRASKDAIKRASTILGKSGEELISALKTTQDDRLSQYSVVPNLKIGTRMADRWTLPRLVDIAQRLGITSVSKSASKVQVIRAIARHAPMNSVQPNTFRVGNKRNAYYMKKSNMVKRAMNIYGVNVSGEKTLKNMIGKLKGTLNLKAFNSVFKTVVPEKYRTQLYRNAKEQLIGKPKAEIQSVLENRVAALKPVRTRVVVPVKTPETQTKKKTAGFTQEEKNLIRMEYIKNLPVEDMSNEDWDFMFAMQKKKKMSKNVVTRKISEATEYGPLYISQYVAKKYLKPTVMKRGKAKAIVEVL